MGEPGESAGSRNWQPKSSSRRSQHRTGGESETRDVNHEIRQPERTGGSEIPRAKEERQHSRRRRESTDAGRRAEKGQG